MLSKEKHGIEESLVKERSLRRVAENYSQKNEEIFESHMLVVHNLELDVQDHKSQVVELRKVCFYTIQACIHYWIASCFITRPAG